MGRPRVVRTPEEQLAYEARRRELRLEYKRRHRAANAGERARHAERMRKTRRDEVYRRLENAAKRRRYHAAKIEKIKAKMTGRQNMAARAGVISSHDVARPVTKAAVATANKGEQCWLSRPHATQTPRTSLRSAACQTDITYPGGEIALVNGVTHERHRRLCHAAKPHQGPQEAPFSRTSVRVLQQTHAEEESHARQSPARCSTPRQSPETSPVVVNTQPAVREPSNVCSLCKRHFSSKRCLLNHEKTHTKRHYSCQFCWQRFADKTGCSNHEKMHVKRAAHVCPVCKRGFSRQDLLVAHTAQCFKCKLCNKRFRCQADVVAHEAAHDERFECDVCKRRFRRNADMLNHAASHARTRAFSCDVCKRRFSRQADMDKHAKSHVKARLFACEVCGSHFLCKQSLIDHRTVHVERKPYACILCHQVFLQKVGLLQHECVPLRKRMAAVSLENSFPQEADC